MVVDDDWMINTNYRIQQKQFKTGVWNLTEKNSTLTPANFRFVTKNKKKVNK